MEILEAVPNSIIAADLVICKKRLIQKAWYDEVFSQFAYIIDYDITDEIVRFKKCISGASIVHRIPWKSDVIPGHNFNYDYVVDILKKDERFTFVNKESNILYEDDNIIIRPGEFIRKLHPSFVIATFKDLNDLVENYLKKYFL